MRIEDLLNRHRHVQATRVEDVEIVESHLGRTAQLRRKFASRLAELSEIRLRGPAVDDEISRLSEAVYPGELPGEVIELYSVADGETTSGFFVPELEFLRIGHAVQLLRANRRALELGLLPPILTGALPIFRDSVGNQLAVIIEGAEIAKTGQVAFVDMEQPDVRIVSESVGKLIQRLSAMKKLNGDGGVVRCPGDFRKLTSAELEIARECEEVQSQA